MKKLSNLLAALVFVSLVIFISCTSDSGTTDPVDPQVEQAEKLVGSWSTTAANVTTGSGPADGDWSNFTLTIAGDENGGTFQTTGVPDGFTAVWPTPSGTWDFDGNGISPIIRGDGVSMAITVGESTLDLTFIIATGGRTSGIDGNWRFAMSK